MEILMISGQFLDCWDLTGSHLLGDQAQRLVSEVSVCIGSWPGPRVCAESGGHHATMALGPTMSYLSFWHCQNVCACPNHPESVKLCRNYMQRSYSTMVN